MMRLCILLPIALYGCATPAKKVTPMKVSPVPYMSMTCGELRIEKLYADQEVETLSGKQDGARSRDMLLNVLVLPGASAIAKDHETELATAKGKVIAIESEMANRCGADSVGYNEAEPVESWHARIHPLFIGSAATIGLIVLNGMLVF